VNELLAESLDKYKPTTADRCVASPPHCFFSARDQALLINTTANAMADPRDHNGALMEGSLK
jgi:hypothetical protein